MATEGNFDKISNCIMKNFQKCASTVKESYGKVRVVPLKEFRDHYDLQKKKIDQNINFEEKKTPTVDFFINAFHSLEQYPSNLKKAKTKSLKESCVKLHPNSSIRLRSSSCTVLDISHLNESISAGKEKSRSLLNLTKDFEELENLPSVFEIYKDFQLFQKQLQQLNEKLNNRAVEENYIKKLHSINKFAQQLEKLMPQKDNIKFTVNSEEENRLKQLLMDINQATFTQVCENSLQHKPICGHDQSLNSILEILSKCVQSLQM